jgi:hypothetical protein
MEVHNAHQRTKDACLKIYQEFGRIHQIQETPNSLIENKIIQISQDITRLVSENLSIKRKQEQLGYYNTHDDARHPRQ